MPVTIPLAKRQRLTDRQATVDEPLNLGHAILFIHRHWKVALAGALLAGLTTLLVLSLAVGPTFEASSTLAVVPSKFSSELKPNTLSLQGYQRLLESDAVVSETGRRLAESGLLRDEDSDLEIGRELRSRIFVARRSEETILAPVIEAVGRSEEPELAATLANTWVQVFLERNRDLRTLTALGAATLIESQYAAARQRLEELEGERLLVAKKFHERLDALALEWDQRLVRSEHDAGEQITSYQEETKSILQDSGRRMGLLGEDGSESSEGREAARDQDGTDGALTQVPSLARQALDLHVRLAQTPDRLMLRKGITDDALWQILAVPEAGHVPMESLREVSLVTQQINPVHTHLAIRLAEVELQLEETIEESTQGIRSRLSDIDNMQKRRSTGLSRLVTDHGLDTATLERARRRELSGLRRERDSALARLDRDIAHQKKRFADLAQDLHEAELARAEKDLPDVHLASPAVRPLRAKSKHLPLKVLVATVLGAIVALTFVGMRELTAVSQSSEAEQR